MATSPLKHDDGIGAWFGGHPWVWVLGIAIVAVVFVLRRYGDSTTIS